MRKQYFIVYESDKMVCGKYDHDAGNAGTLKSAKSIIRNIRKNYPDGNPRNFRVYDSFADVDETTNFVPCVYQEN